jgi:hypothetical protein
VVTTLVCLFFTHEAAGASCARHSLRPLISGDGKFMHSSGEFMPRECKGVFDEAEGATLSRVIARLDRATQYSRDAGE